MNRYHFPLFVLAILAGGSFAAGPAAAHGPQMQITADGGKIVTREVLVNDYAPLAPAKSVYVMGVYEVVRSPASESFWGAIPDLEPNAILPGQFEYDFGPGLAYGVGQTFAEHSMLSLRFQEGLLAWDGSAFVDAGDVQLQINHAGDVIPSSDGGPSAALPIVADVGAGHGGYTDGAHATVSYQFLGDGMTFAEPADGIYLASLVLSSDEPGLADSDPFQFVLHKNALRSAVLAAVSSLGISGDQVQVLGVPEPASAALALLGLGFLGLGFTRRRSASWRVLS